MTAADDEHSSDAGKKENFTSLGTRLGGMGHNHDDMTKSRQAATETESNDAGNKETSSSDEYESTIEDKGDNKITA